MWVCCAICMTCDSSNNLQLKNFAVSGFWGRILSTGNPEDQRLWIWFLLFRPFQKRDRFFVQQIQVLPFCCFRVFINKQQREERSFYCTKNWFISVKIGVNINKFSSFATPPPFFFVLAQSNSISNIQCHQVLIRHSIWSECYLPFSCSNTATFPQK